MYLKETIKIAKPDEYGVRIRVGRFYVTTPIGCGLEKGNTVQIDTKTHSSGEYLTAIASKICSECPLMGLVCRYGRAP